ncbi:unnamed protein product [Soboliphyme baturini]|uniref:[heparan sulfate]-glucosamine N-sulfotransferase n=1 Tax=Soboliphyme baturini TaxID=241478 RepID=A0A183IHF9_9BILA|nr:unnamed protein product [Soboliphyme baturini]
MLFLDGLKYLSYDAVKLSLVRYLQIDIDDVFVGQKETKMLEEDVLELIQAQERVRRHIANFTFNLGFCGKFYQKGASEERLGDSLLVENAPKFRWFPHLWRHQKPHQWNFTMLEHFLLLNQQFAKNYNIPVPFPYAVSPHHSGIYPVHDPLYKAWKKVWGIKVTSTEEYPHFRPTSLRRGFIYSDIKVLPRQTCGLYTHTMYMNQYPGGKSQLDNNIYGGELFYTFIYNPILIFMTHQSNYAHDRLALHTFENIIAFLKQWTNLVLEYISPIEMADKYFLYYPHEKDPLWSQPCFDKRHMSIWSSQKTCRKFPEALIVGPQKTGSTALYTFLKLHPKVRGSYESPVTFEEVQFFNGKNYHNGIDWYARFFPEHEAKEEIVFDKSATYFDCEAAPRRVQALIPDAKIISILISPIKRAYSWYQHLRARNDPVALANDFIQVLHSQMNGSKELWRLRQHCLTPGHYAHHIERWLSVFPAKQILLIDGAVLVETPAKVMSVVQDFLELKPPLDYGKKLTFSKRKGFFCVKTETNKTQCLGRSKGRAYSEISKEAYDYLLDYFRPHNIALQQLLYRLGYDTPSWLQKELQETPQF